MPVDTIPKGRPPPPLPPLPSPPRLPAELQGSTADAVELGHRVDPDDWLSDRVTPVSLPHKKTMIPSLAPVATDEQRRGAAARSGSRASYLALLAVAVVVGTVVVVAATQERDNLAAVGAVRPRVMAALAAQPDIGQAPRTIDLDAAFVQMTEPGLAWRECFASEPTGSSARVVVTFEPSGHSSQARVEGAPLAGTTTGNCVASGFDGLRIDPFDGPPQSVSMTVVKPSLSPRE